MTKEKALSPQNLVLIHQNLKDYDYSIKQLYDLYSSLDTCPFCGGEVMLALNNWGQLRNDSGTYRYVCSNCDSFTITKHGTVLPQGELKNAEYRKKLLYLHNLYMDITTSSNLRNTDVANILKDKGIPAIHNVWDLNRLKNSDIDLAVSILKMSIIVTEDFSSIQEFDIDKGGVPMEYKYV